MINTTRIHRIVQALFSDTSDTIISEAFNTAIAAHCAFYKTHPILTLASGTYSVIFVECADDVCQCIAYLVTDHIHRERKERLLLREQDAAIFLETLYTTIAKATNA